VGDGVVWRSWVAWLYCLRKEEDDIHERYHCLLGTRRDTYEMKVVAWPKATVDSIPVMGKGTELHQSCHVWSLR
jgi:hypothetical protein